MTLFRTLLLICLLAVTAGAEARTLAGRVLAESDSTAVTGATCRLFAGESAVGAVASGADGAFTFDNAPASELRLEVTLAGYVPAEIILAPGGKDTRIGDIYMTETQAIGEVTVSASGQTLDSRGRTIVFPSPTEVKASQTSISLFQKLALPGMEVDPLNRTIKVDGGAPVILVNGVPTSLQEVYSIAPADIARVEYTRQTPARYADRGASGLINITLRKRTDGGSVFLYGRSAFNTGFMDGNFQSSYHQGPSQVTLSYNPSWRNYKQVYDVREQSYIAPDFRTDIVDRDRDPFNYFSNDIYAKYNYVPDSRTLFSATFKAATLTNRNRYLGLCHDTALDDYDYDRNHYGKNFQPSLDLFLRRDFNDRNSLEVQAVGTISSDRSDNSNRYFFADGSESAYITDVDSRRRSLITEVAYVHTFSPRTSLSTGYQNTLSHSRNKYIGDDYRPVLTENNNYVYASLSQQAGPLWLTLSTGAKLFWVKNDTNRRHFVRNLSSVSANWPISSAWNLSARFNYSPGIPSLSALTDFPRQTSPYLITNGNPDLKVSESFSYRLQPSFKAGKFSANMTLAYFTTKNAVFSDVRYLGDRLFLQQSVNSRRYRDYYASLNLSINDLHGFGAQLNVQADRYETAGDGWSHHLNTIYGTVGAWYNIRKWTVAAYWKIAGKSLWGEYVSKGEQGNGLQLSFAPDKHWSVDATCLNLFISKGYSYPSWSYSAVNPGHIDRWIKENGNMLVLSVRYSADFGSIFRSGRRSLNNSDSGSAIFSY